MTWVYEGEKLPSVGENPPPPQESSPLVNKASSIMTSSWIFKTDLMVWSGFRSTAELGEGAGFLPPSPGLPPAPRPVHTPTRSGASRRLGDDLSLLRSLVLAKRLQHRHTSNLPGQEAGDLGEPATRISVSGTSQEAASLP